MEREILKFDSDNGRAIVYDDHEDFKVIEKTILSTSRWSINKEAIVKRISDGKFFETTYSEGATEQQDESPFEYSDAIFEEVMPLEKTVTYYGWKD